jgi:signal peptidase I
MFSAFVHRRPWVAALLGLLLGPFIGMLYLGEGAKALAYFALVVGVYGLPPLAAHLGLLPLDAETAILVLVIAYRIGGAVHCERVARRRAGAIPAAWFARWYLVVALGIVLPFGLRMFVWEPFNVPASSMEPSLQVGDYFFVAKLPYLFGEPRRGDIAVFLTPVDEAPYVKRLVGLPGDRVQMKAGSLYLNGERVAREEVVPPPLRFRDNIGEVYREVLPNGRSYLIREISDQRPLDDTDVYEVPPGHYFFLGDNRDNSLDSRTMIGTVPRENLIGRVDLILWNSAAQRLRLFDAN